MERWTPEEVEGAASALSGRENTPGEGSDIAPTAIDARGARTLICPQVGAGRRGSNGMMHHRSVNRAAGLIGLALLAGCGEEPPPGDGGSEFAAVAERACPPADLAAVVAVPAGSAHLGSDKAYPEEAPSFSIGIAAFRMDAHEVTNKEFAEFVAATGHVSVAERMPDPQLHPDIPQELLKAGSAVFDAASALSSGAWWTFVPGASWRAPEGPGSSTNGREDHPAVHIAYEDALAFARWKGGDLPTGVEWEYAARGGLDRATYEWGETPPDQGPVRANTWQGLFPVQNSKRDGFSGAAPVGCYEPNGYGLHDMTGNVWEWVSDGTDDANAGVIRGGSFLCAANYCRRYRPSARQPQERDFSASHIGFRVIYREP